MYAACAAENRVFCGGVSALIQDRSRQSAEMRVERQTHCDFQRRIFSASYDF